MDIYEFAMQMEKDGENYYRELAAQANAPGMRTILTMLADDEVKHYNVIQQMKAQAPQMIETEILNKAKNVFAQMRERGEFDLGNSQIELYQKAQEIERKSRDFYRQKAEEVPTQAAKALLLQIAEEERKHYFLLENIIVLVSRPQTWLENAEWYHLDEY